MDWQHHSNPTIAIPNNATPSTTMQPLPRLASLATTPFAHCTIFARPLSSLVATFFARRRRSWRMPLESGYDDQLKSKIADMTNLGGRYGGAITAALFLRKFVDEDKPYAHIDIAGPVWSDKSGATGFGAKMMAQWVMKEDVEIE